MQATKTIVQIIQQLLALVAAKEERRRAREGKPVDTSAQPEKNPTMKALLDELSLHGDDVGTSVDHSDPYFTSKEHNEQLFVQAVKRLRGEAGEIPESLETIFTQLTGS